MRDVDIFQMALGLTPPWEVASCAFSPEKKRLDIRLTFPRGGVFVCPECGRTGLKAYDTLEKTWRHLNFFQHEAWLSAKVPRVKCEQCGVRLVTVPWARPGSGFTLLFEALVMSMVGAMPVKTLAARIGESDTRLWRIIHHYVDAARARESYADVPSFGVDETACKRGHNYVSVFVDMARRKVLYATAGKDASTIERFKADFEEHGGAPEQITEVCCDMSQAFIAGVERHFPKAHITFDRFHIMKVLGEAVDEVRREEAKTRPELARSRYVWLKNPEKLRQSQQEQLAALTLPKLNLKTARAWHIKLNFQKLFQQQPEDAQAFLRRWYFWATHSRLEPMKRAAATIRRHWDGILRWFSSKLTNGILEGMNSLIQAAKSRARGYRTTTNLIAMIYLLGAKLDFALPT
jgi:transposase